MKWIRRSLSEIHVPVMGHTTMCGDHQTCITVSSNHRTDARTNHIDGEYHFARDMVQEKPIELEHVPSEETLADFLTRPTTVAKFRWCCEKVIHDHSTSLRGRVRNHTNATCSHTVHALNNRDESPYLQQMNRTRGTVRRTFAAARITAQTRASHRLNTLHSCVRSIASTSHVVSH